MEERSNEVIAKEMYYFKIAMYKIEILFDYPSHWNESFVSETVEIRPKAQQSFVEWSLVYRSTHICVSYTWFLFYETYRIQIVPYIYK